MNIKEINKIKTIIKITTFILASLMIVFNGAFAYVVVGLGVFEYKLSFFLPQFVLLFILLIFWLAILTLLIIKRKNNKIFNIIAGVVFAYVLIGVALYSLGGEVMGVNIVERSLTIVSVVASWPFFAVAKVIFG